MKGRAWLTSEWCSTWHVVDRSARGTVIVATCGHPLAGRMSRVFGVPPPDGREVCPSCVAVADDDQEPGPSSAFDVALVVLAEHRSSRAEPLPEPPLLAPESAAPGRVADPRPPRRPLPLVA